MGTRSQGSEVHPQKNQLYHPNPVILVIFCIPVLIIVHTELTVLFCKGRSNFSEVEKNSSSFSDHIFSDFNSFLNYQIHMWMLFSKEKMGTVSSPENTRGTSYYDDVFLSQTEQKSLELKGNVVYGRV